jgi:ATP-dependent protease Clp ATPase subunit
MEREFVGRLPVRVALQALSKEDLFQVLTTLGTVLEGSADWFLKQKS